MAKKEMERSKESVIHVVTDFNNDLSPAECIQSIHNVFEYHDIPIAERNPIVAVKDIRPFNITDGAFTIAQLADTRRERPSIFVGVVDPGVGTERKGIIITTEENHVFIGPDNGLFAPSLAEETIIGSYKIKEGTFRESAPTFHGRDQFAPLAAEIARGVHPSEIPHLEEILPDEMVPKEFQEGEVVHIDGYSNIKLGKKGIPVDERGRKAEAAVIWTRKRKWNKGIPHHRIIAPVVETFEDVEVGRWLMYEGSSGRRKGSGHIEVAIRDRAGEQGAGSRLGTDVGDVVRLQWQFPNTK